MSAISTLLLLLLLRAGPSSSQLPSTPSSYPASFSTSPSAAQMRWPVFFEHLGNVHSVHNRFDLALRVRINLPRLTDKVRRIVRKLDMLDSEFHDPEARTSGGRKRARRKHETRLDELNASWKQQNAHLRERCQNHLRRARDLRELGEHVQYTDDMEVPRSRRPRILSRKKRQLLKGLFGIAYSTDVEGVNKKLSQMDSRLSSSVNDMRAHADHIKVSARDRMNRQDREIKTVEEMAEVLERKVVIMETNPFMKTSISDLVHMRNEAYKKLSLQVDLCEERLVEVESTVTALGSGRLSKFVISPAKLRETLSAVTEQLPTNYTLLFGADEALWPYYSVLRASAAFDSDLTSALVTVRVPLVDSASSLDLHRVHNLPLKVKDGYSVTADISTEYLVTDRGGKYFLELFKEDFQDCQVYHRRDQQHFYCGLQPMLRSDRARSCVMSLFTSPQSHESAWCQSRLRHGMVQPFERLYNGSWIFSAVSEQIPVILECPGERTRTSLVGFGVLNLEADCTITSEEFWYAHTHAGVIEINAGFGGQDAYAEDRQEDEDEDDEDYSDYDMSKYFENDIMYEEPKEEEEGGDEALIQTNGQPDSDPSPNPPDPTSTTTTTTTTTHSSSSISTSPDPDTNTVAEAGVQVQNPPDSKATEIYKDLLVRLKDTFAQRWQLVKKRRK